MLLIGVLGALGWVDHQDNQKHFSRVDNSIVRMENVDASQQVDIDKMRAQIFPKGTGGVE